MNTILRYVKLLPGWLKVKFKRCFVSIKIAISKIIAVLRCIFSVTFLNDCGIKPDKSLAVYYPDTGSKCNDYCFKYTEPTIDLSIIIPAYNVSKYIDECLKSIISQNTKFSYEIIIVDDGSTDNTYEHLQKYSNIPNIRIYRQDNAGQSVSRNMSINNSKGKHLMFVDGDDILVGDAINILMTAAIENDCSIAEGRVAKFTDSFSHEQIEYSEGKKSRVLDYSKNPKEFLPLNSYSVAKVYKRELWNNVRYPEGYIFEDEIIKFIVRRNAVKVAYVRDVVYGYRYHNQSSSHNNNRFKKMDSVWVLPHVLDLCKTNKAPLDDVYYMLCLAHMGILDYLMTNRQSNEIRLACFGEVRKQLISVGDYRAKKMPLFFRILEKTILDGDYKNWRLVAGTIVKYDMLKKWRERN